MLIVDTYVDEGQTARKAYSSRKEFMRMIDDVMAGKLDLIIFLKMDRWFRSVKDYYKIQETLDKHNVGWRAILENYDTTTASGRLHINIMLSVAQDESDRTSERIKFVFENKVKRKEAITGSIPIGLKIEKKHVVHDNDNTWLVIEIFNHFELNQSRRGTITYIRDKYDVNLSYSSVVRVLSNSLYKGEFQNVKDFCEPLISIKQFDNVQEILKRKTYRRNQTDRIYIFSGLLTCTECGSRLSGAMTHNGYKEYQYYRCYQYVQRRLCTRKYAVSENYVEEYLINHIEEEINSYIVDYEIKVEQQKKPKVNKSVIKNKLTRLKELYINNLIDIDEYKKDFDMYTDQLKNNETPSEKIDVQGLRDFLQSDFRSIYITLKKTEKRTLWRGIIKEIKIDNEKHFDIFFI